MQVEILSESLKDVIDGKLVSLQAGDVKTVPEDTGTRWVGLGWAKDLSGNLATGQRKPGANGPVVPEKIVNEAD